MAWDTALARVIRETSRAEVNRKPQPWYRAEVVQVTPKLIFAIADKEFKFDSSTGLIMTATARAKRVEGRHAGGGAAAWGTAAGFG